MKRRTFLSAVLCVFLWAVTPAQAQIAFDAVTPHNDFDKTTVTWSHTCTGSDRALFIQFTYQVASSVAISTVKYNAVSMSQIGSSQITVTGGFDYSTSMWELAAPATGANTVEVVFAAQIDNFRGGSISFTGVDQSTPTEANAGTTGSSTTPSVNLTTLTNNAWVVDVVGNSDGEPTYTADETERWALDGRIAGGGGQTQGPVTPAGATTPSWVFSVTDGWQIVAASIKPAAAAAARRLMVISANHPSEHPVAVRPSCPYGYERLHREQAGGRKWANTSKTVKMVISDSPDR